MSRERPREAIVWYRRVPYRLDLVRCRRALVHRQIEGALDSMWSVALEAQCSRSTASRFFNGRSTSLGITLRILAALKLEFDEVATPVDDGPNHG
jgi:hypothetical protein